MEEMTVLKVRVLLYLLQMNSKMCNVTHMANLIGVNKSTITRIIQNFEKNKIVEKKQRSIVLTEYGLKVARQYYLRREIILEWLSNQNINDYNIQEEALTLTITFSKETLELIKEDLKKNKIYRLFKQHTTLTGNYLQTHLEEGNYQFPFILQSSQMLVNSIVNDLDHTLTISIKNQKGTVWLKVPLNHHIQNIQYLDSGEYKDMAKDGETFFFPLSTLQFMLIGKQKFVLGTIKIKTTLQHHLDNFIEKEYILTIFI